MSETVTAAAMRALEKAAMESGRVTGLALMERAGQGVVAAILAQWPDLADGARRAVVLCGPGNNGGDGFVVARLLRERGWAVELFLYGDPERLPPDAKANYLRWVAMGEVRPLSLPQPNDAEIEAVRRAGGINSGADWPELIVDALFGTGLARPITPLLETLEAALLADPARKDDWWPRVVAVDIPSGLCADSGRILGDGAGVAVGAHLTVTFHAMKPGHVLAEGAEYSGKVVVAPIGLDADPALNRRVLAGVQGMEPAGQTLPGLVSARLLDRDDLYPGLGKISGHKYNHGHALILSGGSGHGGAARLAARGALRIGAGLVTVGCPPEALAENAARLDAVMLRVVADGDALGGMLKDARINALCLGPGLGLDARAGGLVAAALASGREVVLDADALTLIARDKALFDALHGGCVLTPHGGEFARLFPDLAERLAAPATTGPAWSKLDATRDAAARAGCVVLFKGADTVIAGPEGRCSVNAATGTRAAPWLATAGAGDVLAGFIAGLIARGLRPQAAAETAAWLHVECARSFGPGLIAEDLPEELPGVFRALGV